jgi:hypothetical protein
MSHRLSYAALAAVVLLGVGGCGGDPEPKFADPTSDAPTSSSTDPVTDPPTSAPKPERAETFIRRWHQAGDSMQVTGKTEDYLALGPRCESCVATAELIDGYYEAGGYIKYDGTQIRSIKKLSTSNGILEFQVSRSSPPTRYKETSAGDLKTFAGGESSLRIKIKREDGLWTVLDYSQVAT